MPESEDEWSGSYETGVLSLSVIASCLLRCHAHFRCSIRIPSRPTWSWLSDCCTHAIARRATSPFPTRSMATFFLSRDLGDRYSLRHLGFADAGPSPPQLRGQRFPFFRLGHYRPVTSREIRFKLNESTYKKLPCNAQTLHFFLNTDEDG
jgi:hypothetical protein